MWEWLRGGSRRKEMNPISGSVKVKERARDEEFDTGGTSHWDSTMWSFQEWKTKRKKEKKGDLGIPGSNFRDNNKFPRALGGLERSTSSPEHLEHIYPSNSSWWLEVKIASLDELESEGGKSLNSSWNVYFWEVPEEEEERSGFNALFRACKEIITGAKMQEGKDGGRARNDNLKDFFFFK